MGHTAFESILRTKGGELIPVEVRANYIIIYGVEYYCVSARDITERKKAEKELRQAHDDLEKKVEERTKELLHEKMEAELYLDLMGHDISNMHHIALGQLELAREIMTEKGKLDGDEKELIDTPLQILERSAKLIDNVRKLQKLRLGEHNMKAIDLGALLADVVEEHSIIRDKNIVIDYSATSGQLVLAEPLLKDVFSNLVGNAIKHSNGAVQIWVKIDDVKENNSRYYRVTIEDSGPGIPDDMKNKIFNRLQQSKAKARGMGLGLYLVRSLVNSYNGRVWVEDRVTGDHTRGSRFVVMLPAMEGSNDN